MKQVEYLEYLDTAHKNSVHLQRRLELARAWLKQSRVPVSVRCGLYERLVMASLEQRRG